jgi:hypothetical protein
MHSVGSRSSRRAGRDVAPSNAHSAAGLMRDPAARLGQQKWMPTCLVIAELELRKYDPVVRRHVVYREAKKV